VATQKRIGHNKIAVALANKLARICWAVWSRNETFKERPAPMPRRHQEQPEAATTAARPARNSHLRTLREHNPPTDA
jgi:hypothetical protein